MKEALWLFLIIPAGWTIGKIVGWVMGWGDRTDPKERHEGRKMWELVDEETLRHRHE